MTLTGLTSATANVVLVRPALAAGNYAVTASVTAEATGVGTVACEGRGGTDSGSAKASVGAGSKETLAITFGARLASAAPIEIRCWEEDSASSSTPVVTRSELVAVRVAAIG